MNAWTRGRAVGGALVVVVALTACVVATALPRPAPADASEGFASADAAMRARVRADDLDGGALVVRRGASVLHDETFGSWTTKTVVPIASASKWLTAATLMTFVDEGRLRLDDPVADYLPGFGDSKRAITVRMLLSHTHGLVSPGCEGDPTTTLMACAREVGDGPAPATQPGTAFHYGGTGFVVAGAIIERLSRASFEQAFERRIAEPVGMTTTAFDQSVSDRGRHRQARTRNPAPAASAVSTTADYTRFVAMLAAGGTAGGKRVLSETSVAEIERDQVAGIDTRDDAAVQITGIPTYGLGVWRDVVDGQDQIRVVSGSGALGFYPWIDRAHGTYGIVAVRDLSGPDHAVPLSQRIARLCWAAARD
jgi:CubicO group peptidase (beta-lactamase class C family)